MEPEAWETAQNHLQDAGVLRQGDSETKRLHFASYGHPFSRQRNAIMGKYHIRKYEDRDYEVVRRLYPKGINEHILAGFRHTLRCPQTHLLLLGIFLVAYLTSASFLLSLGVVSAVLVLGWFGEKALWAQFTHEALHNDLLHIQRVYLEPKDCCFWVVETGEEVVAMLGARHPANPSLWGNALELKRMFVEKQHRGRGISKALTRTAIGFAQEHGYEEVVLDSLMVQYAAQRVYEGLGFHKVTEIYPSRLARLLQLSLYLYRYVTR
ncbi:N-acetyltransferase family 8 member 3-like [Hemicordylus capensis]|uniref:N-acetyltransferase family 8 member 3-like n=1 Tax=Hemicordylus capensis TaxID=884348 RepID=UPI0023040AD4|nr:N-acetyltransferase family 8 member 3-like [Hemicordylus capensis]